VPVQTVRKVVERVENKVPVQVCRMVSEEQVRQTPVQVMKMITEERVEPVQVQVMKYVTEERTVQVPRVVEKRVPVTYTQKIPRTVVTKVPLDACGNPIAVPPAPASVSKPTASSTSAPSLDSPPATSSGTSGSKGPVRTYSERPADSAAAAATGSWGSSDMPHADPRVTERPTTASDASPVETIPSPRETEPTLATPGPSVEPAPPAHDQRDTPTSGTSGRPLLRPMQPTDHTT
jgi:hypothetical protein